MNNSLGSLDVIVERNIEVPMRDGTVLRSDIWRPDAAGQFPVLIERTVNTMPRMVMSLLFRMYGEDSRLMGSFTRFATMATGRTRTGMTQLSGQRHNDGRTKGLEQLEVPIQEPLSTECWQLNLLTLRLNLSVNHLPITTLNGFIEVARLNMGLTSVGYSNTLQRTQRNWPQMGWKTRW